MEHVIYFVLKLRRDIRSTSKRIAFPSMEKSDDVEPTSFKRTALMSSTHDMDSSHHHKSKYLKLHSNVYIGFRW